MEVVDELSSSVEVGSEEDQTTDNLNIIAGVLNDVTGLINSGDFFANLEVPFSVICLIVILLKQIVLRTPSDTIYKPT